MRRTRAAVVSALGVGVVTVVAGCNPAPVTVQARQLAPISHGSVHRIAVLPFTASGDALRPPPPEPGQAAPVGAPADTVTLAVVTALERMPVWQIVDDAVTRDLFRRLYGEVRAPTPAEALAVGKALGADAVLRGEVREYEERVGTELAAKRAARVVFAVELVRVPGGERLWQAEYAETQRALSDNLWNLFGFLRAGGRWLRAHELAALGAEHVTGRLHRALYGVTATPMPRA